MKYILCLAMAAAAGSAHAQTDVVQNYIESAFKAMDTDGDRQISRLEFDTFMLKRMQVQRAALDASFAAADVNGDGFIDRREAKINEQLNENFAMIDTNGDGKVSKDEIVAALVGALNAETQASAAATNTASPK